MFPGPRWRKQVLEKMQPLGAVLTHESNAKRTLGYLTFEFPNQPLILHWSVSDGSESLSQFAANASSSVVSNLLSGVTTSPNVRRYTYVDVAVNTRVEEDSFVVMAKEFMGSKPHHPKPLNHPEFDKHYHIQYTDYEWVRKLFPPQLITDLIHLKKKEGLKKFTFSSAVGKNHFHVECDDIRTKVPPLMFPIINFMISALAQTTTTSKPLKEANPPASPKAAPRNEARVTPPQRRIDTPPPPVDQPRTVSPQIQPKSADSSNSARVKRFNQILKRYTNIPLENMAKLLQFSSRLDLEAWLLDSGIEGYQITNDVFEITSLDELQTSLSRLES